MKKLLIFLTLTILFLLSTKTTHAALPQCSDHGIYADPPLQDIISGELSSLNITVRGLSDKTYILSGKHPISALWTKLDEKTASNGKVTFTITHPAAFLKRPINEVGLGTRTLRIKGLCILGSYNIKLKQSKEDGCDITFHQGGHSDAGCYDLTSPISISAENIIYNGEDYDGPLTIKITPTMGFNTKTSAPGVLNLTEIGTLNLGAYDIKLKEGNLGNLLCSESLIIDVTECEPEDREKPPIATAEWDLCRQVGAPDSDAYTQCTDCIRENQGFWTGLGCIGFTPQGLVESLLPIAIAIAGGIALLIMLFGVFTITTSGGNPENVQKGKETITAAIIGLLFIIFSIVLLNLIGVKILAIPGF